eukprot:TRINITY_DN78240_c0_g1_i1.p1 TRINITY_DN78240_c0_g1~~TRINITY_DN78240_c0_g1_i1.p1  ORF type:complete len:320 (+),score=37.82 TRINITY_DN78240_c0_g1_i1:32-991(+)
MSASFSWHYVRVWRLPRQPQAGDCPYRVSSKCRSKKSYAEIRDKFPDAEEVGVEGSYKGRYSVRLLKLQSHSVTASEEHPDNVLARDYAHKLGMIESSVEVRATVVFCIKAPLKFVDKELEKLRERAKRKILWTSETGEPLYRPPSPRCELWHARFQKPCPICEDPRDAQLACGHKFCSHCVARFMAEPIKCPLCRKNVRNFIRLPPGDARMSSSEDESYDETEDANKSQCFHCSSPAGLSFTCFCRPKPSRDALPESVRNGLPFPQREGNWATLHACASCSTNWRYCNCRPEFRELSTSESSQDSQPESSENEPEPSS